MLIEDSNRTLDEEFGYLTVENCVLTGNDVAAYYGKEVPNFKALGLEPEKIYWVYRPEKEIKNSDFTNKPLLSQHADFSAEDYKHKLISGTVGETFMEGEQKKGTVVFWDKKAIDELEKGKKYLSCGYLYTPVLEKGFYKNTRYDIKMTNIIANHVAMVDNPRYKAALVADEDSQNPQKGKVSMFFTKKKNNEQNKTYTFDEAIEDIKKILVSDEEESKKEKAVSEVKKKVENMSKDKMSKDKKMGKDKKEKEGEEDLAEDEGEEEGEYGEGAAEDEELMSTEQKKNNAQTTGGKKMTGDSAINIQKLVTDAVAKEMETFHKKTIAFDSAIKEYERTCGRVNKLAFDSAEKVLNTILKNHGKNVENKSFEQMQAMVEMLPDTKNSMFKQTITMDSNSTANKNHTPDNILKFLKRG